MNSKRSNEIKQMLKTSDKVIRLIYKELEDLEKNTLSSNSITPISNEIDVIRKELSIIDSQFDILGTAYLKLNSRLNAIQGIVLTQNNFNNVLVEELMKKGVFGKDEIKQITLKNMDTEQIANNCNTINGFYDKQLKENKTKIKGVNRK